MLALIPHLAETDIIRRSVSTPSLQNVYRHRPVVDAFLKARPLPALISTSEHRTAIMEEEGDSTAEANTAKVNGEDKDISPPPSPSYRRVYLADACILVHHDTAEDEIHPPILLTASTCNQNAMQLRDHVRVDKKDMSVVGWVSSLSLEHAGWLVAGLHGWRQMDGETHLTWGTFQIITRYKWMSRNVPEEPTMPKLFSISIERSIQTDPVTGLWGWMVTNTDSSVGM
jgi:hypothetical protein